MHRAVVADRLEGRNQLAGDLDLATHIDQARDDRAGQLDDFRRVVGRDERTHLDRVLRRQQGRPLVEHLLRIAELRGAVDLKTGVARERHLVADVGVLLGDISHDPAFELAIVEADVVRDRLGVVDIGTVDVGKAVGVLLAAVGVLHARVVVVRVVVVQLGLDKGHADEPAVDEQRVGPLGDLHVAEGHVLVDRPLVVVVRVGRTEGHLLALDAAQWAGASRGRRGRCSRRWRRPARGSHRSRMSLNELEVLNCDAFSSYSPVSLDSKVSGFSLCRARWALQVVLVVAGRCGAGFPAREVGGDVDLAADLGVAVVLSRSRRRCSPHAAASRTCPAAP